MRDKLGRAPGVRAAPGLGCSLGWRRLRRPELGAEVAELGSEGLPQPLRARGGSPTGRSWGLFAFWGEIPVSISLCGAAGVGQLALLWFGVMEELTGEVWTSWDCSQPEQQHHMGHHNSEGDRNPEFSQNPHPKLTQISPQLSDPLVRKQHSKSRCPFV